MTVGKNIKLFRISIGLKQKDLAAKLDVNESYLSTIENDKKEPSLSLLKKIAEVLNIPISMFFWDNTEEQDSSDQGAKLKKLLFQFMSEISPSHEKPKKN